MTEPVDSSFINVDLELHCAEDLAPLRAHFGEAVLELHCGETDDGFFLAVESLAGRKLVSDALRCTDMLLDLVDALPAELRELWDRCRSRRFDYGFEGGLEGRPFSVVIDNARLSRLTALGIDVAITLYPYSAPSTVPDDLPP